MRTCTLTSRERCAPWQIKKLVEEMKAHREDFLERAQNDSRNEMAGFWLRKTKKPVSCARRAAVAARAVSARRRGVVSVVRAHGAALCPPPPLPLHRRAARRCCLCSWFKRIRRSRHSTCAASTWRCVLRVARPLGTNVLTPIDGGSWVVGIHADWLLVFRAQRHRDSLRC